MSDEPFPKIGMSADDLAATLLLFLAAIKHEPGPPGDVIEDAMRVVVELAKRAGATKEEVKDAVAMQRKILRTSESKEELKTILLKQFGKKTQ